MEIFKRGSRDCIRPTENNYAEMCNAFGAFRNDFNSRTFPQDEAAQNQFVERVTGEFEILAMRYFSRELGHFKEKNQTTIGSRYKNADVEYKRTLNSLLGAVILTPTSESTIAQDTKDIRYQFFTHKQKKDKLSIKNFQGTQKNMLDACKNNEDLGLLLTILSMHDTTKLGSVAKKVEARSGISSINHDILLAHMTVIPALYQDLAPRFASLSENNQKRARQVMNSAFNRGQLAQAECSPVHLTSIHQTAIDSPGLALLKAENTADLTGLTGDLGTLFTNELFFMYQTADQAIDQVRAGRTEIEAYTYLLQQRLEHAALPLTVTAEDYATMEGRPKIALARLAVLTKADTTTYQLIEDAYRGMGDALRGNLQEVLTRTGLDEKLGIILYYLPALLQIILAKENSIDPENGASFGINKGLRLAAHLSRLALDYLENANFDMNQTILAPKRRRGIRGLSFRSVSIRGTIQEVPEFVFGLDEVVKALQDDYQAFSVPNNPHEAFFAVK